MGIGHERVPYYLNANRSVSILTVLSGFEGFSPLKSLAFGGGGFSLQMKREQLAALTVE